MKRIGLQGDTVELLGSGLIGIVQFIAVIPAILSIDKIGRGIHTFVVIVYTDTGHLSTSNTCRKKALTAM